MKRLNFDLAFPLYDDQPTKWHYKALRVSGNDALVLKTCMIPELSADEDFVDCKAVVCFMFSFFCSMYISYTIINGNLVNIS